ncbi:MAG TPA: hypothetical protein VK477_07865, partial [Acidobacteriota bacterium]|nr:hypothetical protein [Acidobacteriota bacterium]
HGRPLWSIMSGDAVVQIYRGVLRQVRGGRPVTFRYRCDTADEQRCFEMRVSRTAGDQVQFHSRLLSRQTRGAISWLSPRMLQGPPVTLCSWCGRVEFAAVWREVETAVEVVPDDACVEHGICPDCAQRFIKEFATEQK